MYTCVECDQSKSIELMNKVCGKGLKSYSRCKECSKEIDKKRKADWYLKNKERLSEKNKLDYIENKDNYSHRNKEYYKNNKEKCNKLSKSYYENNKEYLKLQTKEYRIQNKDHKKVYDVEYRINNVEKIRLRKKLYRQKNIDRVKDSIRNWKLANPDRVRMLKSLYKKKRKLHTPKWLTSDHKQEILQFYKQARELTNTTGIIHEVDHIIPLKGKTVWGLHVPWNLQVLTREDNNQKSNKLLEEYICQI